VAGFRTARCRQRAVRQVGTGGGLPDRRRSIACCTWVAAGPVLPFSETAISECATTRTGRHVGDVCWSTSGSARRKTKGLREHAEQWARYVTDLPHTKSCPQ